MPPETDPVLRHSRREAIIISVAWLVCTAYCCGTSYWLGYNRADRPLGPDDVRPILGMPSWVLWGFILPWFVCGAFNFWFAGWFMADDDLGRDHADELETDIREGGAHG